MVVVWVVLYICVARVADSPSPIMLSGVSLVFALVA